MDKSKFYTVMKTNNIEIDYDVFEYALYILKQYFSFLLISSIIALYFGILPNLLFFILFFIPLRTCIGGLHFNKKYTCLLFSFITSLFIAYSSYHINFGTLYFKIGLMGCYIIITFFVKPTDHFNKRVSEEDKLKFKKNSILILFSYSCLLIVFEFLHVISLSNLLILTSGLSTINNCVAKFLLTYINKEDRGHENNYL